MRFAAPQDRSELGQPLLFENAYEFRNGWRRASEVFARPRDTIEKGFRIGSVQGRRKASGDTAAIP